MVTTEFFSPTLVIFREPIMGSANHPVRNVLNEIVDSCCINAEQVKSLEDFVRQDWVIDKNEAEQLLRVNHALNQNDESCPEWSAFFVTSISRLIISGIPVPILFGRHLSDHPAQLHDSGFHFQLLVWLIVH